MKKIVALLLTGIMIFSLAACSNTTTVSSDSTDIVKRVEMQNWNVYKAGGDGTESWFEVTPQDFFKKFKKNNSSIPGLKLSINKTKYGDSYSIDTADTGADIDTPSFASDQYEKYISKIEMLTTGGSEEEAKANGKLIDALIKEFNSDEADAIEKELYIFDAPPQEMQPLRHVICGDVEYSYSNSGQFDIEALSKDTTESQVYRPEK